MVMRNNRNSPLANFSNKFHRQRNRRQNQEDNSWLEAVEEQQATTDTEETQGTNNVNRN